MCDKVQEIIDAFNLLSPENQGTLLKCACDTLEAEDAVKRPKSCTPRFEEIISEEGDVGLME